MVRISVRHSVAAAYGLLFGRPFTVVGLTWLPAAFYAYAATYLIRHMNSVAALGAPGTTGRLGEFAYLPNFIALVAATALFGALISVSLSRHAFGMREEPAAAHLVFGMREFRLFLALLRYYALVVGSIVVFALVAGIAISQLTRNLSLPTVAITTQVAPLETWLNSVAATIASIFGLICAVRYGFFLPAIATVEDSARMGRARGLSQGNFWTLTAITLIVGGPAGILLVASEKTLVGLGIAGVSANALPFAAILTVGLIVLYALFAGASAAAYSEMAEAHVEDADPYHPGYEPAGVFAAPAEAQAESYEPAVHEAFIPPEPSYMEVATPEAEGASEAARTFNWMAPPAEAHFGSDPHDTNDTPVEHTVNGATTQETEEPSEDTAQDAHSDASLVARLANEAGALSGESPIGDATTPIVGIDAAPADVPDHAHDEEIPVPPFDPAGIASAQQVQHPPN
jgi:hypothetical protein